MVCVCVLGDRHAMSTCVVFFYTARDISFGAARAAPSQREKNHPIAKRLAQLINRFWHGRPDGAPRDRRRATAPKSFFTSEPVFHRARRRRRPMRKSRTRAPLTMLADFDPCVAFRKGDQPKEKVL